jgi:hypothetical protein
MQKKKEKKRKEKKRKEKRKSASISFSFITLSIESSRRIHRDLQVLPCALRCRFNLSISRVHPLPMSSKVPA